MNSIGVLLSVCFLCPFAQATPIVNDFNNQNAEIVYNDDGSVSSLFGVYQNSGELLFVAEGNNNGNDDTLAAVEALVVVALEDRYYNVDNFVLEVSGPETIVVKNDKGDVMPMDDDGDASSFIEFTNSGTWEVVDPVGGEISFYAVKASNYYAMYLVDPADNSGSWSTYHIWETYGNGDSLEISHYTGYDFTGKMVPNPEPLTALLFGTGIIGFISRRVSRKK